MFEDPTQSETGSAAYAFQYPKIYHRSKLFFLFQAGSTERKRTSGSPTMVPGLRGHGLQVIMIMVSR